MGQKGQHRIESDSRHLIYPNEAEESNIPKSSVVINNKRRPFLQSWNLSLFLALCSFFEKREEQVQTGTTASNPLPLILGSAILHAYRSEHQRAGHSGHALGFHVRGAPNPGTIQMRPRSRILR